MKKALGGLVLLVCMAGFAAAPASASKTPQKIKDIRQLLEVTGSGKLGVQMVRQILGQFEDQMPDVPKQFWDDFAASVNVNDLENLIIPIYGKYLSDADIRQIIHFYESPAGKRFVSATPQMTREAMEAGRQWGMNLARKLQAKLEKEGYTKQNQAPSTGPSKGESTTH